jgi:hypothetical protein
MLCRPNTLSLLLWPAVLILCTLPLIILTLYYYSINNYLNHLFIIYKLGREGLLLVGLLLVGHQVGEGWLLAS